MPGKLSPEELVTLITLSEKGQSNSQIARTLGVTEGAVRYHLRRAAAQGRTAADLRAAQPGLFKRPAEPDEIAAAIAFLASLDASYVTGTNLMVDAGGHAS